MTYLRWIVLLTLGLLSAGISTANDCEEAAQSASGPTIGLKAAGPSVTVDVACHFTSATSGQTFTVSSTDPLTVAASLNGTLLTLDPGHVQKTATVTVTRGIESYAIDVAVTVENQPPTVHLPLRDTTLASHGYMTSYSLSNHFSDPEGSQLTYSVTSSDPNTVGGSFNYYGSLTVTTGEVKATTTDSLFVTATDPGGLSAKDTLVVTVTPNVGPVVDDAIGDTTLAAGGTTASYTLSEHFTDPDGGPADLTYGAAKSEPDTVSAAIEGGVLEVTPEDVTEPGTATITVTATDKGGLSVSTAFDVAVTSDCVITPKTIADLSLASGGYKETYTLTDYFSASNCTDDLSYSGSSSKVGVALANASNGTLTVTSVGTGTADITVTATSGTVSRSIKFEVTVTRNQAPTVTIPFRDVELTLGGKEFDSGLTGRFSDPEGGPLTFSVGAEDSGVWGQGTPAVTAGITGNRLTVTADFVGVATVMVRAIDPGGVWATDEFAVRVVAGMQLNPDSVNARSAPAPVDSIPAQALTIVGSVVRFDVAPFFMESDGDAVMYSARLATQAEGIPDYVSVDMSGSMLTLTPGTTSGSIDVLVSASDTDGRASQTFTVHVANAN